MTTCPYCNGRLHAPDSNGDECDACKWGRLVIASGDPGTAPTRIEHVYGDDSIMTPYGKMSGLPRDRGVDN